MDYKALILDLDGTLVPYGYKFDRLPPLRVRNAINSAKKRVYVSTATGRPLQAVKSIIDRLALNGPCVICNGIQIYDPNNRIIIEESSIDRKVLPEIMKVSKKHKLKAHYYDGLTDHEINHVTAKKKVLSVYLPKIDPSEVDKVEMDLKNISDIAVHKMPSWEKGFLSLDITDKTTSKLHAISNVFKILGVNKVETIGVGDSYNDYPLLMACGLKIAMGNAVKELKAIADFIAPPVEEDGVATVINKFILKN